MAKENDIFDSIDLESAMKDINLDGQEATEEDIELATKFGINLQKVEMYKKKTGKTTVMHQGYPTKDFLDFYIDAANNVDMINLQKHKNAFRESQQSKIEKEKIETTKDEGLVARYIDKNQELIAEKDKLFKKVQELQTERDALKERIESDEMYLGAAQETEIKLQDERNKLAEKYEASLKVAQKVVDGVEVMEYNQKEHELLIEMINIFRENKIKTNKLNEEQIQLVKELSK